MAVRWRDPSGFRAEPTPVERGRPSRLQAGALLTALIVVAGTVTAASYFVEPERARSFDVFHGSLFLNDSVAPVAVDLATGRPTIRLIAANTQVSASDIADLSVVPVDNGTVLLNRRTGEFNMADTTGFVIKNNNTGGVLLPNAQAATSAFAVANGASAYIVRTGPSGTSAYLVNQSTVQAAANGIAPKPRAFRTVPETASADPGAAAAANGQLWLLLGSGTTRAVTSLAVPADSAPGVQLAPHSHGKVDGAAAIATVDGAGGTTVGVASTGRVLLVEPTGESHTVRFTAPGRIERILPASNSEDRLSYLLQTSNGWYVLSIRPDGSGLRGPTALSAIPSDATLVAPATSRGLLYTMITGSGALLRIDERGAVSTVPNMAVYPLARKDGEVVETTGFPDAYTIARGARVIFNSPSHNDAVVLFTDGTHSPMSITKSSAVEVSAAGGALALTKGRLTPPPRQRTTKPRQTPPRQTKPPATTTPAVNNQIDCQTASQRPHIPLIDGATPGSRSVALSWQYPLLDRQDCEASTYVVSVKLVDGPVAPQTTSVTVQGQRSTVFAGLYPESVYDVTVTAYINTQGTTSAPRRIRTGPEGPTAPAGVTASVDATGSWLVQWTSCGTVSDGCVPSSTWQVIPQSCDTQGLSTPPATQSVTADPSTTVQPGTRFVAPDALLGRSLRFQVQGIGPSGEQGTVSSSTACLRSWRAPDASAMTVSASVPSSTAIGQAQQVTAAIDLGSAPTRAAGGVGASVTFTLTGGGQTQTSSPITFDGSTGRLSTTFGTVLPGRPYVVTASVSPPGHPEAAVGVGSAAVKTASVWPTPAVTATCQTTLLSCALSVQITNISSAGANGESFTLADGSQVRCGNVTKPLTQTAFDPVATVITSTLGQLAGLYGQCTVTVALNEVTSSASPYYGNVTSPATTVPVDLGSPSLAGLVKGDLTVGWGTGSGSTVALSYTGTIADDVLGQLTSGWSESLTAPDGTACGSDDEQPTAAGVGFPVSASCVNQFGGSSDDWKVTVTYTNSVDGTPGPSYTYRIAGPVPGYQQCAPTTFGATWGPTIADGVAMTNGDDPSLLEGCSGWTYELDDATSTQCATASGPPPQTVGAGGCGTPPAAGWTVVVRWNDTAGNPQSQTVPVTGDPPTS